jgi:hypothetical protein
MQKRKYFNLLIIIMAFLGFITCVLCSLLRDTVCLWCWEEEQAIFIEKGTLTPGVSSGVQTITDPYGRHIYTFAGEEGQTIRIHVEPFSDTFLAVWVLNQNRSEALIQHYVDEVGERGDDVDITVTLPNDGTYVIEVSASDAGEYSIQID